MFGNLGEDAIETVLHHQIIGHIEAMQTIQLMLCP
jgi:hypothetical protein